MYGEELQRVSRLSRAERLAFFPSLSLINGSIFRDDRIIASRGLPRLSLLISIGCNRTSVSLIDVADEPSEKLDQLALGG